MSRPALRTMLAFAVAAAVSSLPAGAEEKADRASAWVPDEVRATGSTRFT